MSLLIKALQKAEQSKESAATEKSVTASGVTLELAPHHDDVDMDYSLAEESGFHDPLPTKKPAAQETRAPAPPPPPIEHHAERAAAANVFRAHTEGVSDPGSRRAFWLGMGGLLFLMLIGAGFYLYLESIQQPDLVVMRPSQPITPAPAPAAPPPAAEAQLAPSEPVAVETPPVAETGTVTPDVVARPAEAAPLPAPVLEKPLVATTPAATRKMQQAMDSEKPAVEIRRNRKSEPAVDATAMAAYQAFSAGDDAAAGRLYRQLLQSDPRNLDALLGLAAVAARQENGDEAAAHYARALELDPRNSVAQAGLIALLGQADPVAAESRLKSLLAQQPDAAYLHAALGGVYAEKSQWANAQQAYFQAFHLDPGNAEYAFNLAVSLDQLSKPDLALDFYQRARDLLPGHGGAIDRASLGARIDQLRSALGK